VKLHMAWCTHAAALHACTYWHYSGKIPKGKLVKVGVWEDDRFIGVIIFGYGATRQIGAPYGLKQTEVCELTRIALREHSTPVSKLVARALVMLKRENPGVRLVVSYADSGRGHRGGIYQAGNWVYVGASSSSTVRVKGEVCHRRVLNLRYGTSKVEWLRRYVDPTAEIVHNAPKHKYLMPLDRQMRRRVKPLALPYPRGGSINGDAPTDQVGVAGSIPARRSPT
jgi:hypothetical protein